MSGRRIAILGGGMGGLTAAWRLSEPGWTDDFERITVYQRGARLGGKAASSRGANGRIEEHGLHIWLGYYDNAFAMMRECYEELDRSTTRPSCPIRELDDAFSPSVDVGLMAHDDGAWSAWMGHFATNDLRPGDPGTPAFTPLDMVQRGLRLLDDLYQSLAPTVPAPVASMSTSPTPPTVGDRSGLIGITALAALDSLVGGFTDAFRLERSHSPDQQRLAHLVEVVVAQLRGIVADGLLLDPGRIRDLNDEDFMDWIIRHGASEAAAHGTLVRGLYDLVFGFADGDTDRAGFGAGLGLFLSAKTFFDYKGAIFWKMAAGMGDVVIAPLYQALLERGVEFEFFTRIDDLHLDTTDATSPTISAIDVTRQAHVSGGPAAYRPLVDIRGLPCFSRELRTDQLDGRVPAAGTDSEIFESHWWPDEGASHETLRRGIDFDHVIFAIPVGMARHVTGELSAVSDRWRAMVDGLGTVATEALQLWIRPDESEARRTDCGRNGQRVHATVRHVGVDAAAHRARTVARRRQAGNDRLLLFHHADRRHRPDDDRPGRRPCAGRRTR
ncbi:MAG: NAD(P)-binding protein [Microthrixaceae bacterium]